MYTPMLFATCWPKFWKPARSAYTVLSMFFGQSLLVSTTGGMKLIMYTML